jgi:hypothetical protein
MSLRWPGLAMRRTGFPKASPAEGIFMLSPPRGRPRSWASAPPFYLARAGSVLMRPHDFGVLKGTDGGVGLGLYRALQTTFQGTPAYSPAQIFQPFPLVVPKSVVLSWSNAPNFPARSALQSSMRSVSLQKGCT